MNVCPECGKRYAGAEICCERDGTGLVPLGDGDPRFGTIIAERYLVLDLLGQGGMGTVYRAQQLAMGRQVALKVLPRTLAQRDQTAQRFIREARLTAGLRSPNTVTVHDFGRLPEGDLYLVMELVQGRPLDEILKQEGSLPPERVRHILVQACRSLEEAHGQGLVHRDLKPANVMVERQSDGTDFAKVLDFGIAKLVREDASGLTAEGTTLGTAAYMSPEQAFA